MRSKIEEVKYYRKVHGEGHYRNRRLSGAAARTGNLRKKEVNNKKKIEDIWVF